MGVEYIFYFNWQYSSYVTHRARTQAEIDLYIYLTNMIANVNVDFSSCLL